MRSIFWYVLHRRILAGTIYFQIRKSMYFWVFKIEKTHISGSNFEFLSGKNVLFRGVIVWGNIWKTNFQRPKLKKNKLRRTPYWTNHPHMLHIFVHIVSITYKYCVYCTYNIQTIKQMASLGFAKLLRIKVLWIYS